MSRPGTLAALRAAYSALGTDSEPGQRFIARTMVGEAIQAVEAEMNAALRRKAEKRRLKRQAKKEAT